MVTNVKMYMCLKKVSKITGFKFTASQVSCINSILYFISSYVKDLNLTTLTKKERLLGDRVSTALDFKGNLDTMLTTF